MFEVLKVKLHTDLVNFQLIRSYKLEYHHEPLKYKVTFMYAPDGELKFKVLPR